jgi:hypothetical protein
LTTPTTPTTVSGRFGSFQTRLPIGFSPAQNRCANFSSTMTTGCAFCIASNSEKKRPATSGISIVRK